MSYQLLYAPLPRYFLLIVACFSLAACAGAGEMKQSGQTTMTISVVLDGKQSVPPVDTSATGSGKLVIDTKSGVISGGLELSGIEATKAHIHKGNAGENGGVIVTLTQDGYASGQFYIPDDTMLSPSDLKMLLDRGMYFQVHSETYPKGEIRGQIVP